MSEKWKELKMIETQEGKKKCFDEWNIIKKSLDKVGGCPNMSDGEVWWCAMGEDIGVEVSGKGERFLRPVLVMRKINKHEFFGVPLTAKLRRGTWYVTFVFNNKRETAALIQTRAISTKRLVYKMGEVPESDLRLVKQGFLRLFSVMNDQE